MIRKKTGSILLIMTLLFGLFGLAGCKAPADEEPVNEDLQIQQEIMESNRKADQDLWQEINKGDHTFQDPYIAPDPFGVSPLTGVVGFKNTEPVGVMVTIPGDVPTDSVTYELAAAKEHMVPIIGLYPNRINTVTLSLIDANGTTLDEKEIEFETTALPETLENAVEITHAEAEPIPGLTLVSGGFMRHPYMYDTSGMIRWYLEVETDAHGYFPAENGRFFLIGGYGSIPTETRDYARFVFDMDYLGRLHKVYDIPGGIHHEIVEKEPGGNLLILGNSLEGHVEDTIAEVHRETGEIVREINFADYISGTKYNERYDWAHINSLSYDRSDGTMILSPRDVSSVVKIDWDKEEILWILSDPEMWEGTAYESYVLQPVGDTMWHYEQHAAFEIHSDIDNDPDTLDLMLFDNRTIRNELNDVPIKGDENRSSITQYAIDEEAKTVVQVRRFPNSHAIITSNFELYPEKDRLLANHGSVRPNADSPLSDMYGEIFEYEYSTGKLLHSVRLRYGFYRAHRITLDGNASARPMEN
ncbi:aryl-sulfate sulfotransferase [Alkalibacter rhizosphaerae]|uniref:Aryl-sulfate sulfotransferase n=1 Tax=Alkalibacter rhizosphaerae TaxID=2815577 RepID=A0A974XHF7_9FIRM|nr:aryl-sulfate sulfotransferase [Alkalibacter rhizosphaerae]QSX08805.1 aryl-sulfate sulfotransferase [Alkalibacter rhizosphaerae]